MDVEIFVNKIWKNSFLEPIPLKILKNPKIEGEISESEERFFRKVMKRKNCSDILFLGIGCWTRASTVSSLNRHLWNLLRKFNIIVCRSFYVPRKGIKNWNTDPKMKSRVCCTKILFYTTRIYLNKENKLILQKVLDREEFYNKKKKCAFG